jgi:CDGSH-type Zn-finger protein
MMIKITFKRRGTILIEGEAEVRDEEGTVVQQPPAKHPGVLKLCGCGRSATRPFCDGSHKTAGEAGSGSVRSSEAG